MDISVIVTALNEKKFIGQCLSSLLSQDIDFEIIVVDDGSTDGTQNVVREFQEKHFNKIRFIRFDKNQGVGNVRNIAASVARGRVVVFLDADMSFPHEFVRKLSEPILEGKKLATVHSKEEVGNTDNRWVKVQGEKVRGFFNSHESGFFRAIDRNYFLASGGFDASKGYFDDASFHQKTGLKASIVDVTLTHYHPDTIREIFRRNRWIGKSVLKAHRCSEVLAMVVKRLFDLSPFVGVVLLFAHDFVARLVGLVVLLFFGLVVARHRVLPSESLWGRLVVRFLYVPAYRWVKALGFLTGVAESLLGRGWKEMKTNVSEISAAKNLSV